MARLTLTVSAAALLLTSSAWAAAPAGSSTEQLEPAIVSATRLRGVNDLDVPASITTVQMDTDNNNLQTNVTEVLGGIPGVTALDRQNYAQDTQLSIRGFGARATFGVRGLRLYADGIPASMPDGQGQLSHFSLLGADRIQIMRGPFSALYGNSSGGVVQIWSQPGTEDFSARLRATLGSHDERTFGGQALGTAGPMNYNLAASRFETDGYRDHSAARRDSVNLRLGFDTGDSRELTLVLNYVDIPEAQDPLGVTPADWRTDPRQTASVATQFNTRKSVEQLQGGVVFEQKLGIGHTLHTMAYAGNRKIVQYLAIPTGTQANPLHSGGVVDLDTDYRGGDLRWSWQGEFMDRPVEFTLGGNYDLQVQLRRGYNNFVGTTLGVRGTLRRDETNRINSIDEFAQGNWQFTDRWSVLAGVRHSEVNFKSTDRYIVGTNGNDGGHKRYGDTTAVGGLMFRPVESLRLYASMGDGFETPTFNEISYRADGAAGLALNLKSTVSDEFELGAKWRPAGGAQLDIALFRANSDDDLVVVRNVGGRSSFRNIDRSRRQGIEAGLLLPVAADWQVQTAYTLLDATFRSTYLVCASTPCTTPNVTVPAGSRIPGVARHQGQVRLQWAPGVWTAAVELNASSNVLANDTGTARAPGYGVWNAELGHSWKLGDSTLRGFARVDNLLDHSYVGSVIVNEGNSRYFEAATDRTATIGVQWRWH
ncbi:MAG: TonB-dependent receptor [Steroidobacteraceae bacterium]